MGNRRGLPKRSLTFAKMGKRSKKIMKYSARQGAISKLSPARKLRAVFRNHNMFDECEWYQSGGITHAQKVGRQGDLREIFCNSVGQLALRMGQLRHADVNSDLYVRFGSKTDICVAKSDVRFAPNSDRESGLAQTAMSALPPKADMCSALGHVCFGPKADVAIQ